MIHTGRDIRRGTQIELRRGDCVIVARVVWRDGGRAGLQSQERIPVEEIITLGQSPALQLTAADGERRKQPRPEGSSKVRARALEFTGVIVIAASLAGGALTMVEPAFARPLALVGAVLGL